jgi:hypothetical protein
MIYVPDAQQTPLVGRCTKRAEAERATVCADTCLAASLPHSCNASTDCARAEDVQIAFDAQGC